MPVKTPVSGTVIEFNPLLADTPELMHKDPYDAGWLAIIAPTAGRRICSSWPRAPRWKRL